MSNENNTDDDLMKDFEALQRELEKSKKAIDREVEILKGKIEELTEKKEKA